MRRLIVLLVVITLVPCIRVDADQSAFNFTIPNEIIIHPNETLPVVLQYENLVNFERNFLIEVSNIDDKLSISGLSGNWTTVQALQIGTTTFNLTASETSVFDTVLLSLRITCLEDPNWILEKDLDVRISRVSNLAFGAQDGSSFYVQQNTNTTLSINISNNANYDDNVKFRMNSTQDWKYGFAGDTNQDGLYEHNLSSNESVFITFWIETPSIQNGLPLAGSGPRFTLSAESGLDSKITSWYFDLEMQTFYNVTIDRNEGYLNVEPGESGNLNVTIRNNGNVDAIIDAFIRTTQNESDRIVSNGWTIAIFDAFSSKILSPNESKIIEIGFDSPNVNESNVSIDFVVRPESYPTVERVVNLNASIILNSSASLSLTENKCPSVAWNDSCVQMLQITNTGNFFDEFYLDIDTQTGMNFNISSEIISLSRGDVSAGVPLTIEPQKGADGYQEGSAHIDLRRLDGKLMDSIIISSYTEPYVNWIFGEADTTTNEGRLDITITLRNDGNIDDGLVVSMSSSYFTDLSLTPPPGSIYDDEAEKIRTFEVIEIDKGKNFSFSAWAEIPDDQLAKDDFYINITADSRFNSAESFFYSVNNSIGILEISKSDNEENSNIILDLVTSAITTIWAWKWILISVLISGIMINKSLRDRINRRKNVDQIHIKTVENSEPRDWMKDFDKSESSKPIIVESPTISTDNFTKIFESKGNLNKPVTEPVDSSIVGVANSVLSKNSNTSAQTNEDNLEKPIIREVSNPINEKGSPFDDLDL